MALLILVASPALAVDGNVTVAPVLPGFALDLFDGTTGTVSVSCGEFAAPVVMRANGTLRLVWNGHPRLGAECAQRV